MENMEKMENLLELKNVTFSFRTYGGVVQSVRDVSFNIKPGEIVGIVGESGCGKSVTSQCILKLNPQPPGFFGPDSSIKYKGEEIVTMSDKEMRKIRLKKSLLATKQYLKQRKNAEQSKFSNSLVSTKQNAAITSTHMSFPVV